MSGAGDNSSRKKDAEDCKNRGNEFLAKKEFQTAVDWYTQAIQFDPSNHVYYSNRSAAYLSMNYKDSALKDAKECVRVNPNWSKGYSRVGAAYHSMMKYDEAIKAYDEGLHVDPGNAALQQAKDDALLAKNGPEPSQNDFMQQLMRNPAVMAYFQSHPEKLSTLSSNPMAALQDPEFMQVLQSALTGMGGMGGMGVPPQGGEPPMGDDFSQYEPPKRDRSPSPPPKPRATKPKESDVPMTEEKKKALPVKEKGNELYKSKQFVEAIKCYQDAQELDPSDIIYTVNIAACQMEMGSLDTAVETCHSAIEKARELGSPFESIAKAYSRMGNCYFKQKLFKKAIECYENSLLEQQNQAVKAQLLEAKRFLEKQEKEAYEDPALASQHKERGNELMTEGKVPDAIKEYDEAIKRNPNDAILYCNRGAAYSKLMDYGRALTDIEKSLKLDPKYIKAWGRKGLIEYSLKKYHRAIEAYQMGLSLDPNNKVCIEGLQATEQRIQEVRCE